MLRETYARIDLGKIAHNIRALKQAAGTDVMAVIKADAYGHGMRRVAETALREGVQWLAVATPEEALELKETAGERHILILSPVLDRAIEPLVAKGISLCVCDAEQLAHIAQTAERLGKQAKLHIKTDTGMGRVGIRTREEMAALLALFRERKSLILEGIFTHFASADEADKSFTYEQGRRFAEFCAMAEEAGFSPVRHAANSAAIIDLPELHFDLCRMGISLYGYPPSDDVDASALGLQPAMELWSYVSYRKTIHAGDTVSYGRLFRAERDTEIATVPIGYADGYRRSLTGKAWAYFNGKKAILAGRVCMDQIMFDVTGLDVKPGDRVLLMGRDMDADQMGRLVGTISYEILTGISPRVPRVYVEY